MKKPLVLVLLAACGGGTAATKPDPAPGPVAETPPPSPQPEAQPEPAPPPAPVAVGKPKTDLIPRTILFGNPERANVQLSPDGKHLSWLAPKDGVLNVFVAPVGKLEEAKVITAETTRPIRGYFWPFTSKHVIYIQDTG